MSLVVCCVLYFAGPCWLEIHDPNEQLNVSWCQVDVEVKSMESIRVVKTAPEPAPLVVASISLKTCINPATKSHEICMASVLISNNVSIDGTPDAF